MTEAGSSTESKATIMVVDDAAVNRKLVRALLERTGYRILECASGQECLDQCENALPDMILLDVMMPGIDGFETCSLLREKFTASELPIILITALSAGDDVKHGIERGANDYVTKPLDRSVLIARVENQLSIARSYRMIQSQQRVIARSLQLQASVGDALEEGVVVTDQDEKVLYANLRAREFCYQQPLETLDDLRRNLFRGKLAQALGQAIQSLTDQDTLFLSEEFRMGGSEIRFIEFKSYSVDTVADGQQMRIWTFRDVTQVRTLEQRISQQVKMDTVSLFSVGVAHNFNNLLGSVLGASEVLSRITQGNPTAERCVNVLQRAVQSGKCLTGKMATFLRKDFSASEQRPQDLSVVIHTIVDCFKEHVGQSVRFHLLIKPDLPSLAIESTNLHDIVANIVRNAIDAVHGDGIIWISLNRGREENDGLVLKVWDNGCGMSPAVVDRVFEPFFSTKNLDAENGVSVLGNGLGMWNVYSLLKGLDGAISIRSAAGEGTEVTVTFPVALLVPPVMDELHSSEPR